MGLHKIFGVVLLVGAVAAKLSGTEFETTTSPIPSLRFIDNKNKDGSYTFGFETKRLKTAYSCGSSSKLLCSVKGFSSEDGTYKVETKHPTGEVTGTYGFIDSTGILRESSYGPSENVVEDDELEVNEERDALSYTRYTHFKPRGIERKLTKNVGKQIGEKNEQSDKLIAKRNKENKPAKLKSRFEHFRARKEQQANDNIKRKDVEKTSITKIVNGRRAILKKRLRIKPKPIVKVPSTTSGSTTRKPSTDQSFLQQKQVQARKEQMLRALEKEKLNLLQMHQSRHNLPITKDQDVKSSSHLTILLHPEEQIEVQNKIGTSILPVPKISILTVPKTSILPVPKTSILTVAKTSQDGIWKDHPFISGFDLSKGSYSVNYGSV